MRSGASTRNAAVHGRRKGDGMKWEDFRRSDNVEDRTGAGSGGGFPGGGGMKLGGGALIVVVIVSLLFGVNPLTLLGELDSGGTAPQAPMQPEPGYGPQRGAPAPVSGATPQPAPKDPAKEFSARILGDTEDVWGAIFQAAGTRYAAPKLVLFRGAVQSACGRASAAVGPFYCSEDRALYLDTAFFDELSRRFKAPGDFAQAYVIAHEVGHHVQNLTGTMKQVDAQMERQGERGRNDLSVRLELQADCYAGVWGYLRTAPQRARRGRPRRRIHGRVGDRRRQHPEAHARVRGSGFVHARLRRAAVALVQDRTGKRRHAPVQHVRGSGSKPLHAVERAHRRPTTMPGPPDNLQLASCPFTEHAP